MARQDLEIISVVGMALAPGTLAFSLPGLCAVRANLILWAVTFGPRFSNELAQGAGFFVAGGFPVKPIVLARGAEEFLGVFGDAIVIAIDASVILPLGHSVSPAGIDRIFPIFKTARQERRPELNFP